MKKLESYHSIEEMNEAQKQREGVTLEHALIATLDLMDFYAQINGPNFGSEAEDEDIQWTELNGPKKDLAQWPPALRNK